MKSCLSLLVALTVLLMLSGCEKSVNGPENNSFRRADELNKVLGAGVNIGNALEAPNEGEWGVTIKQEYFTIIKSMGFSSVRIPIRWSAHTAATAPYTINETFFRRVDAVVTQALDAGLKVIINIHHYNELFDNPDAERAKFIALWQQIAERYKSHPDALLFELLNEPNGNLTPQKWNTLQKDGITEIRKTNPERTVIIGLAEWGGPGSLDALVLPANEKNIILTVHYYEPFVFTHQGAEWVTGSNNWLGTLWSGTVAERNAVQGAFAYIKEWSNRTGIPVNIGEFGSYNKADYASRVRWTGAVVATARLFGFSYHYWEFCAGFGFYNPGTGATDTGLANALLK